MIIGKKCQNTPFFTRFPHCVELFEEMVGGGKLACVSYMTEINIPCVP